MWSVEHPVIRRMVNITFRKGIRRDLGMRQYDSVCDRLGNGFKEVADKIDVVKQKFMERAINSPNV